VTTEPVTAPAETPAPRLAEGVELIGEYEGSGFKEPPHIVRRADGQVIQLSRLLYLVAEAVDGERDPEAIAAAVTERFGRTVSPENVEFLVDKKLRPLGVLAAADGSSPKLSKRPPLLALRYRKAIVPERAVARAASVFRPLFWPPVLLGLLAGLIALDAWIFFSHGIGGGLRSALYNPVLLLGMFGVTLIATAYHELGHASACRYGGAKPGVLGAGVYIVWPAFYCDVTDAYRLSRGGRLRTDLGGVYFNALFALVAGALFLATGFEALVLVILTQHMIILQQLMPLLRFDGYYVVSDLTGVPDILSRIKPIFASLIPGRAPDPRVQELKSWVRVVVTAYVVVLVPVLAFMLVSAVMGAPRMFATAYDSLGLQVDRLGAAAGDGKFAVAALGVLQLLALILPCAALVVSLGRTGLRTGGGLRRWTAGSAPRTALAGLTAAAALGFAAYTWWPNGDYEPLRPGERGTVGEALSGVSSIPSGRPSFQPARAERYAAAPTVREGEATKRAGGEDKPAGDRPAASPTPEASATPEKTAKPEKTATPEATATPEKTATPEQTAAPQGTAVPTATATVEATATPVATATPEATATATATPPPGG
jgi:putative peptide zinc metalloprotease protein